jgi:hypothetical protein
MSLDRLIYEQLDRHFLKKNLRVRNMLTSMMQSYKDFFEV